MTATQTTTQDAEMIRIAKEGAMKHCLRHAWSADEIGSGKVWQRDAKAWYVELFLNNWRYTVLVTNEGSEGFRVWPSKTERMD